MYDSFARLPGISVFCWVVRLCTKTLILVSVERSVQYRERSDRMAHATNQPSEFRRNVECAIRSLRSRYCTVGMLLFVQRRLVLKIREAWSDVASFVSRLNLGGNDFLF